MKVSFSSLPRYFLIFFVVFSGTIFFVMLESFRSYRAEAELLVLSRSASIPSETAAKTFAALPDMLVFYDRLLSEHDGIEDPWSELSRIERKDRWGRVVEADVLSGTNLLRFSVSAKTPEQATALLSASLETLYGFAGRLYDRDTEADIRLIERSGIRPIIHSIGALTVLSLLLGGALAFLVSTLFRSSLRPFSMLSFPLKSVPGFSRSASSLEHSDIIRPVGNFSRRNTETDFLDTEESVDQSTLESEESIKESLPVTERPKEKDLSGKESKDINEVKRYAEDLSAVSESTVNVLTPVRPKSSPVRPISEASAFESVAPWNDEPAPAIEQSKERNSDEPEDIWERPRNISSITRNEAASGVLAAEGNRIRIGHAIRSGAKKQSPTPGNLETISAEDFKWENVLAPIVEGVTPAPESPRTKLEDSPVSSTGELPHAEPAERREPTSEELKARLNELLRGEM